MAVGILVSFLFQTFKGDKSLGYDTFGLVGKVATTLTLSYPGFLKQKQIRGLRLKRKLFSYSITGDLIA